MFRNEKERREFWRRNRPSTNWPLVIAFTVLGILAVITVIGLGLAVIAKL